MNRITIICLLMIYSLHSKAQDNIIDAHVYEIDSMKKVNKLEKEDISAKMPTPEKVLIYTLWDDDHYLGHEVLIETTQKTTWLDEIHTSYYSEPDSGLLKVIEVKTTWKEPKDIEKFIKKHTLPDGSYDFSSIRQKTETTIIYFSSAPELIYYVNGKKKSVSSARKTKIIYLYFDKYNHLLDQSVDKLD